MNPIVSVAVTLLTQLLQLIPMVSGSASTIGSIISTLVQIIPAIEQAAEALVPPIKAIIAALSADPATTADQLATLQALDAQCDQAFESAAVDASVDNPAPAGG